MSEGNPRRSSPSGARQVRTGLRQKIANYILNHRKNLRTSFLRLLSTPLQSLMTVLVIAIAMAMPAGLYVGVSNIERLGGGIEVNARMSVFIKKGATEKQINSLIEELEGRDDVFAIDYVSAEQALEEFRLSSGFGDVLSLLDSNPLPSALQVTPVEALISDQNQLTDLVSWIQKKDVVDEVSLDLGWLQKLQALVAVGRQAASGLGVALAVGVLLVMGNTIRLAIENRREEIVVVKLIGGTDSYVRRPFLYSGFWLGFLAGILAWILVWLGFQSLAGPVEKLSRLYQSQYVLTGPGFMELIALGGLGAILGLAGTWVAVFAHMRTIEPE